MPFFEGLVAPLLHRGRGRPGPPPALPRGRPGPAQHRLTLFLAQYWGGPRTYDAERGHPRLRMRHAPFAIDAVARDRWLALMRAALAEESATAPTSPRSWTPTWRWPPRRCATGLTAQRALRHLTQVREDREHAAVILGRRLEAELAQDDPDVALDGLLGQAEPLADRRRSTDPRPSAPGPRARAASARRAGRGARPRPSSVETTSGSTTEPPPPTRRERRRRTPPGRRRDP